ncbi:MAG: exonuclease domain-containing protein, partial [Clostridia bacterium]
EQTELFGFSNSENSDIFKDTLYVIFDLETTGIGTADKITEIGAVKMKDGKIVGIFETLVNPEMKLSDNIIELTGITNDMVEGAPKFEEVVADFYKFTRGAVLVAHNTRFDLDFLRKQALPLLYNFDNDSLDTMMIAQQYMKLKNYKLKTVCKEFGVEIENAHRALNDAIATARVFKKLMLLIKNKR